MLTDLDGTARPEAKGTCMRFYAQAFNSGWVVKRSIVRDPEADPRLRVKTALTPRLNSIHDSSIVFFSFLFILYFSHLFLFLGFARVCPSHVAKWYKPALVITMHYYSSSLSGPWQRLDRVPVAKSRLHGSRVKNMLYPSIADIK